MRFRSTRHESPRVHVSDAIERGLAPDGGLYVPERFPARRPEEFDGLEQVPEIAARSLAPFFEGDPLADELEAICRDALDFPIPLRRLDDTTSLLELFHGPTAAFKDVGARFLAACLERIEARRPGGSGSRTILVATSGDTGSAIAAAFHGTPGIEVGVLFPEGGVSARQQHQLTCWGDNIRSFAVRGVFDDCQRVVKAAFADDAWRRRKRLTSANSINIGRLLPQAAYYACASLWHARERGRVADFIVPSGNVGNACAALWAREMGMPLGRVVLSANVNRPVPDYFSSGTWSPRPSIASLANAMDVGDPSNMERVFDLYPDVESLRRVADSDFCDDERIRRTIAAGPGRWGSVFCPHTATAVHYREGHPDGDAVIVATAHPAKFESVVEELIGRELPLPDSLVRLLERPAAYEEIEAELPALQRALED